MAIANQKLSRAIRRRAGGYPFGSRQFPNENLAADATQMAEENARLRKINAQMLAALQYVLPLLQEGLPATVNFDWSKEAVAKVQDALAEAERDP
jgi:hypothetical protein